jgi:hypothetical protein
MLYRRLAGAHLVRTPLPSRTRLKDNKHVCPPRFLDGDERALSLLALDD